MLPDELSKANVMAHLEIPLGPNYLSFSYLGVHEHLIYLKFNLCPLAVVRHNFIGQGTAPW